MEISNNTAFPQHTLVRALDTAQRKLNRRVFARRITGAIAMGLILCFPILPVMLYFHLTVVETIITFASLNGMVIAVRLLTGAWANGVDAAVFLERQYKAPGLFITAADVLARSGVAQKAGRHDAGIIFDAAHRCQSQPATDTKILLSTSVDLRIWAANGLLLIALLITAEVGQAMMAHAGREAGAAVMRKTLRVTRAVAANQQPKLNSSAQGPRTHAVQKPLMESRPRHLAQHRATDAVKQIQASITHLLTAAKIRVRRTVEHGAGKRPGTDKGGAEALQSQLLAAARLPGVGTKAQTMLLAAAHAVHASSQGNFVPLLRRINRRLESYLASTPGRIEAISRHSESNGNGYRARTDASITKHTGSGTGRSDLSDRAGEAGDAIVTDIPSKQRLAESVELRWGQGNPAGNVKIPPRYRMAVQRYFSHSPTVTVR